MYVETEPELIKLAKKLKKESVYVDVINFGQDEDNVERFSKFIETLNGKNTDHTNATCNLINIPVGTNVNDSVRNSAICGVTQSQGENAGVSGGAAGNNGMDWMDDPNMDPDLALAIRVSLEESRARQQQELTNSSSVNVPSAIEEGAENTQNINSDAQNAENEENRREEIEITMQEDDEVLMQALQMSLANNENSAESENNEENSNLEVGNENENMVEATA